MRSECGPLGAMEGVARRITSLRTGGITRLNQSYCSVNRWESSPQVKLDSDIDFPSFSVNFILKCFHLNASTPHHKSHSNFSQNYPKYKGSVRSFIKKDEENCFPLKLNKKPSNLPYYSTLSAHLCITELNPAVYH